MNRKLSVFFSVALLFIMTLGLSSPIAAGNETNYTIVYWLEKADMGVADVGAEPEKYTYHSEKKNVPGITGATINFTAANVGKAIDYAYYSHTISSPLLDSGRSVVNVYFKRIVYTFVFDLVPRDPINGSGHINYFINDTNNRVGATYTFNGKTYGQGTAPDGTKYNEIKYEFRAKLDMNVSALWPYPNGHITKTLRRSSDGGKTWNTPTANGTAYSSRWYEINLPPDKTNYQNSQMDIIASPVLTYAPKDKPGTITYKVNYDAQKGTLSANIWLEVLPHETSEKTAYGKNYIKSPELTKHSFTTTSSEYGPIPGFIPQHPKAVGSGVTLAVPEGTANNRISRDYYLNRNKYTLSFETFDGSAISDVTDVMFDLPLSDKKPTNPTKKDSVFGGWYTNTECSDRYEFDFNTAKMPNNNLKIFAKWESEYAVTFISEGTQVQGATVVKGETVEKPTDPVREGYEFKYWSTTKDGATAYDFSKTVSVAPVFYAVWVPLPTNYTIIYWLEKANMGVADVGTDPGKYVYHSEKKNVAGITGETINFTAANVDKAIDYACYSHTISSPLLGSGNSTVNVYFKRIVYTFIFDLVPRDPTGANSINYFINDTNNRVGAVYTFYGKTYGQGTAPDGTKYNEIKYEFRAKLDMNVLALWPYPNGNIIKTLRRTSDGGKTWNSPTANGVAFSSRWYEINLPAGKTHYQNSRIDTIAASVLTYAPKDKPGTITYKVNYDAMPGTLSANIWLEALPHETPEKTAYGKNYILSSLLTKHNFTTTSSEYGPLPGFTPQHPKTIGSGVTLAVPEGTANNRISRDYYLNRNKYTLSFETFNGSAISDVTDVMFDLPLSDKKPTNPTKKDSVFVGWYTNTDCSDGYEFNFNTAKMPNNNLKIFAKWQSDGEFAVLGKALDQLKVVLDLDSFLTLDDKSAAQKVYNDGLVVYNNKNSSATLVVNTRENTATQVFLRSGRYNIRAKQAGKNILPDLNEGSYENGVVRLSSTTTVDDEWYLEQLFDGNYLIKHIKSGYCLTPDPSKLNINRCNLLVAPLNGTDLQRWKLSFDNNNSLLFCNVSTGKYMDVSDTATADKTPIIQWILTNGANQKFTLQKSKADKVAPAKEFEDLGFAVQRMKMFIDLNVFPNTNERATANKSYSDALYVYNNKKSDTAQVSYVTQAVAAQSYLRTGRYHLTEDESDRCLLPNNFAKGAKVQLSSPVGHTKNEDWYFERQHDGGYVIRHMRGSTKGYYLSLSPADTSHPDLIVTSNAGTPVQKWEISFDDENLLMFRNWHSDMHMAAYGDDTASGTQIIHTASDDDKFVVHRSGS